MWREFLHNADSPVCLKDPQEYEDAIHSQAQVCARLFPSPLVILCGEAGTGKTTVVEALLKAVEKVEGSGTSMALLAPTGKAADRMREKTGRTASTIHSFLARNGWLNDNLTFKLRGGKRVGDIRVIVLDNLDGGPVADGRAGASRGLGSGATRHPGRGSEPVAAHRQG